MPPAQTSTPPSHMRTAPGGYRQSTSLAKIPSPASTHGMNGIAATRTGALGPGEPPRPPAAAQATHRRSYAGPWLQPVEYADDSSPSDGETAAPTPRASSNASRWSLPVGSQAASRSRDALLSALSAVRQAEAALRVAGEALNQAISTVATGPHPETDTDELLTADESQAEAGGLQARRASFADPNLTPTSCSPSEGVGIALGSPASQHISAAVPSRIGGHLRAASLSRPTSRREMYAPVEDGLRSLDSSSEAETATEGLHFPERRSVEHVKPAVTAVPDQTPHSASPADATSAAAPPSDVSSDIDEASPSFRFELDVPTAELEEGSDCSPGVTTLPSRQRGSRGELGGIEINLDSTFIDPPSRRVSLQPERRAAPSGPRQLEPLSLELKATDSPELKSFMEPPSAAPSEGDFGAHLAFSSSERAVVTQDLNDDSTMSVSASTLIERASNFLQSKQSGTAGRSTNATTEDRDYEGDETAELIEDAYYQPLPQPIAEPHQLSLIEECTEPATSSGWDTTGTLISDTRSLSHRSSAHVGQATPHEVTRTETSATTATILDLYGDSTRGSLTPATPSRRYLESTDHTPASTSVLAALIGHNLAADISLARNDGPATPEGGDMSLPQFGSPDGTPLRQVRAQYARMLQISRKELSATASASEVPPPVPSKTGARSPEGPSQHDSSTSSSQPQLGKSHWSSATSSWNISSDSRGFQLRSDLTAVLDASADHSMPSATTTGPVGRSIATQAADETRDRTSAVHSSGSLRSAAVSSEDSELSARASAQGTHGRSNSFSRGARTSHENQQRRKIIQEQRLKAHQQGVLSAAALIALTSFDSEAGTPLTPVAVEALSAKRADKQRATSTPAQGLLTDNYALPLPPPRQEAVPFSHPREAPCPPPRGGSKKRIFLPQRRAGAVEAQEPSSRWPSDESRHSSGALRSPPPPPPPSGAQDKAPPLPSFDGVQPGEAARGSTMSVTKWFSRKAKGLSGQALQPRKVGSFDALKDLVPPKKAGRPRSASVQQRESTDDSDAAMTEEIRDDDTLSRGSVEVGTGWLSTHGNALLAPQTPETYRSASPHSRDWARIVSPDTVKGRPKSTSESFTGLAPEAPFRAKQVAAARGIQLSPQVEEPSSYFPRVAPAAQSTPMARDTQDMRRTGSWGDASPTLPPPHSARTAASTTASERDYRRGSWLLAQAQSPIVRRVSVRSLGDMPILGSAVPPERSNAADSAVVATTPAHGIGETPPVHPSSSRRRLSDLILRRPLV